MAGHQINTSKLKDSCPPSRSRHRPSTSTQCTHCAFYGHVVASCWQHKRNQRGQWVPKADRTIPDASHSSPPLPQSAEHQSPAPAHHPSPPPTLVNFQAWLAAQGLRVQDGVLLEDNLTDSLNSVWNDSSSAASTHGSSVAARDDLDVMTLLIPP